MNQLDLNGRHAIVTGGAAGLGLAITQRFLASGAQVTWWDRDAATMASAQKALGALAGKVQTVLVDVSEHASVVDAVRQTVASRPQVDALVNCAGITGPNVKVWDYPPEQWLQVMQVNLNGLFYCCREVVPLMCARNAGRIVNIASVAGMRAGGWLASYAASKAALIHLTKVMALELAAKGIRVNAICPGTIESDMHDALSDFQEGLLKRTPLRRFGRQDDLDGVSLLLASDAGRYIVGAAIPVDGGQALAWM